MVSKKTSSYLAFIFIPFMLGCGAYMSSDLIYKLQDDVRDVKKDVSELKADKERKDTITKEMGIADPAKVGDVELALRKEIAGIKADIEALRGEINAFQGFIDETRYQIKQDQLATDEKIKESDRRVIELEGKVENLMAMKRTPGAGESRLPVTVPPAAEKPLPAKEERKDRVFTSEREIRPTSGDAIKTPEDLYDFGLGLIKANKFKEARKSLDEFAKSYPDHRLMPNVFYWRGETFYAEKDYESAAITFQEVIDRFPESPKAPDALYKQGMCFFNMEDPISARAAFNLLLSKYPTSIAAGKAKGRLGELNEKGG